MDVAHDGFHIFRVFLLGIGVVEAEVAGAAKLFSGAEIHDDGLRVSDVEIAVGLGREAGVEASAVLAGLEVFLDVLLHKVQA